MTELAADIKGRTIPAVRPGRVQTVSVTATTDKVSNAFKAATTIIEIQCDVDCHYAVGANPTATTVLTPLTADVAKFVRVIGGADKIAFIRASGASDGTAYVTEGV